MDKYTYADVIIDPADPRVEIGAEYWFSDCPNDIVKRLNNAKASKHGYLSSVESNNDLPFYDEDSRCWLCIIRKKEPSYKERQNRWIAENNIKIGDKVRVTKKAQSYENGWNNVWIDKDMDSSVNKVYDVVDISDRNGIRLNIGDWNCWYPYFVLEKVEEPEFKVGDFIKTKTGHLGIITKVDYLGRGSYIVRNNNLISVEYKEKDLEHIKGHIEPFDFNDPEVRRRLTGEIIIHNCFDGDDEFKEIMIVGFMNKGDEDSDCWSSNGYTEGTIAMIIDGFFHADELLKECTFLDGTPCGIVVEDE